jgi:hypothetical protein
MKARVLTGIAIILLIDLLVVIGFIGYQVWRHHEETSEYSITGRDLGLQCGSHDNHWGKDCSKRILCNPRIGEGGYSI